MSAATELLDTGIESRASEALAEVRTQFPILSRQIAGKPLVYLDNAATTQKPQSVIESVSHYYRHYNANVHRGVHTLSQEATEAYEGARQKLRDFINARHAHEIIYLRGATEAINLIAHSFGQTQLRSGDEVLISQMEHHSNIVPWQLACERSGASLKVLPIDDRGDLHMELLPDLINDRTKLVAIVHVSNALGTVNPVADIVRLAHQRDVPVLLDGAQATPHLTVDVQALDCDFFVFSGHKMFAPTGIGALYGKEAWLEKLPPYQGGGDMIKAVSFEKTVYNDLPYKFEAGTPHIAGAIGLGAAVDFLNSIGMTTITAHEHALLNYAHELASVTPGLRQIGTAKHKAGVFSFLLDGIHPHDIGTVLDHEGVAIRAGHHCAMPAMERYKLPGTARASFALYNTRQDIDTLFAAIRKALELFG
jgi:cysteine desulfurase/selenocysteine lyase